jgi:hypothetical protein
MLDPVSIGKEQMAKRDTVLIVGLQLISPVTGQHYTPMIGGKTLGVGDHTGARLQALTLAILDEHPAGLDARRLLSSLALVVGDGAISQGGSRSRHPSTGAAEMIWSNVFAQVSDPVLGDPDVPMCTDWGLMHRDPRHIQYSLLCDK